MAKAKPSTSNNYLAQPEYVDLVADVWESETGDSDCEPDLLCECAPVGAIGYCDKCKSYFFTEHTFHFGVLWP